jgi:serine/threonine protein kinase
MARHASWELEPGAKIAPGRSVLKRIGGGNRYEVHLVWDDDLFAIMVAKLLRPDRLEDSSSRRGMAREAEALENLAHPVLLRGFGAELDGDFPHLLVEHLEGPTLGALIRREAPLPLQQTLPLIMHIAAVLHYISTEGWVHLDVKPDNIVMGIPPRLIDLSLARTLDSARRVGSGIGTRAYMPPEQCEPEEFGGISPASDVWGIGATAYHAITGKLPFPRGSDEGDLAERYPQVERDPDPLPESVPAALGDQILRCLRRDPDDRPTASELATALEPLALELPRKLVLGRRGVRYSSTGIG